MIVGAAAPAVVSRQQRKVEGDCEVGRIGVIVGGGVGIRGENPAATLFCSGKDGFLLTLPVSSPPSLPSISKRIFYSPAGGGGGREAADEG